MRTITLTGKIESDGHLKLDIPTQLSEGEVSILVVIDGIDETVAFNDLLPNTPDNLRVLVTTRPLQSEGHDRYPLRNSIIHFHNPTEPIAEEDWDVL